VPPRLVATRIGAAIPRVGAHSLLSRSAPAILREHPARPVPAPFPQHSSRCCLPRACALPASESPTRAQLRPPFRRPSRRCRCRLVLPPPEPWSPPASERLCLASSSSPHCAPAGQRCCRVSRGRAGALPRCPRHSCGHAVARCSGRPSAGPQQLRRPCRVGPHAARRRLIRRCRATAPWPGRFPVHRAGAAVISSAPR